ncbi:glycosyltransferase [Psittacicella hinzii]|uniref:Uncharacterized protein n=1 Tax=Psittacicella hinzii TaxID=2028575 RepID=A0A3A1YUN4_9GAMM|nr:hypothetical protein [Psittacicella hinzii]RIY40154.1 hypothetical protein CKF58_01065 [Psittacicella hinzii]
MSLAASINNANSKLSIFIVADNTEHTYENISTIYYSLHLARLGWPAYLLDIEGSSAHLISPSRSLPFADLEQLDLHNPERHYVFLFQDHKYEHLVKLKQALGVQATFSEHELEAQMIVMGQNPQYPDRFAHFPQHTRAFGNGAKLHFVLNIDNIMDLHKNWQSFAQIASFNFDGYLIRGTAGAQSFITYTQKYDNIVNKPLINVLPTLATEVEVAPKKLRVCFSQTRIRFMCIDNIKYLLATHNPELFEQVEFVDVAEWRISDLHKTLNQAAVYIALDLGNEIPSLVPEALQSGCVVIGFGGQFDNLSNLDQVTDFTPEANYELLAKKLEHYLVQYQQGLATDANYLHPLAQQGINYARLQFSPDQLRDRFINLLRATGIPLNP